MCIPDLTASWFLPLYSKSKHRTIIFLLMDWFCKGLIFLHKIVHQIWAFEMDSGGSTSTVNCIASISVWFRRKEWGMRVIKKNIGQAKERGGGKEERKNTPSPPPSLLHFLALVSFFAPLKPKIPFHDCPWSFFILKFTTRKCLLLRLLQLLWAYPLLSTQSFC